jgi:hypothetical protein
VQRSHAQAAEGGMGGGCLRQGLGFRTLGHVPCTPARLPPGERRTSAIKSSVAEAGAIPEGPHCRMPQPSTPRTHPEWHGVL